MKTKIIVICLGILVMIGLWLAYEFDFRKVNLRYAGRVIVNPSWEIYHKDHCAFSACSGKNLREKLENEKSPFLGEDYTVEWESDFVIDNNATYYLGYGCEIEEITYFYHTRYFNVINDPTVFSAHNVKMNPLEDRRITMLYIGDVGVIAL